MLDDLPQEERQLIEPVFLKYAHLFRDDETNDFKGTNIIEHEIPVGEARPLIRLISNPYAIRDEIKTKIGKMLH